MSTVEQQIFKAFRHSAQIHSDKTALVSYRKESVSSIPYRDLLDDVVRLGEHLKAKNVSPGDRVILLLDNQTGFSLSFFAVMYARAVAVPLDIQYSREQIENVIRHSQAKMVILSQKMFQKWGEQITGIPLLAVDSKSFLDHLRQGGGACDRFSENEARGEDGEDLAVLFYTSGTTDLPKAVMLTHHNLLSNCQAIESYHIIQSQDILLSFLPLHHAYAFTTTLLIPLLKGAQVVYPEGIGSLELAKAMQATRTTLLVGVPQVFFLLERSIKQRIASLPFFTRFILSFLAPVFQAMGCVSGRNFNKYLFGRVHQAFGGQVRHLVSGGAKLDPQVARSFLSWGFSILEGYGLTETSPVVSFTPVEGIKVGSVGKPLPGCDVRILDPDEAGVGEILIQGPNVMKGYYQAEEQTKEVFKDGWFFSGDLGCLDEEGYLFIAGRKKELIVLGSGKNIYPEEVEREYQQIPFIKELAVLVSKEGAFFPGSERLVAVIVIDEEYFRLQQVSNIREKIKWEIDNVSVRLPTYKRIQGFSISQTPLPRTRLGKIKRYELEPLYSRQKTSGRQDNPPGDRGGGDAPFQSMTQSALLFVRETLQRDVREEDHLELDLGLDSLGRIELLLNIQEQLNLELDDEQSMKFFMCNTIRELMNHLKTVVPDGEQSFKEDKSVRWEEILLESPQENTINRIKLFFGPLALIFNIIVISLCKLVFKIFFFLKTEGGHNLPEKGPYLICPNHASYLDGLFVVCSLPYKIALQTYFVGYSKFFERFYFRPFIKIARLIPLEISHNLIEALRACSFVLRQGKIVCYFPEGQRSIDGEMNQFKRGVGILLKELAVPVVPVFIEGSHKAWPRTRRFPRPAPVKVFIGAPKTVDALISDISGEGNEYDGVAAGLRDVVGAIKQQCIKK